MQLTVAKRRSALLLFGVAAFTAGCGGDGKVETVPDNWPADVAGPAGEGGGVRVFSGSAATLSTNRSCTKEEGAQGDRWCVFVGLSSAGEPNLFAVNVSQVIAGVPVSCDTPDANCLVLTEFVAGSSADFHPTFFAGDTLVYYDKALTAYVWRPGMEAGRLLASRDGTHDIAFCTPAAQGTAVACLAIPFEQPDDSLIAAELYAGSADGESEPLLAPVDSVIAATTEDTDRVHRFGFGPLSNGYIAWSSREEPGGPEFLELQRVGDPDSRIAVATDVHDWSISGDGSNWLWVRAANELGIGTLQIASFPDGAYPTDVIGGVFDYRVNDRGSVVVLNDVRAIISVPDPLGAPDEHVLIDSEVGSLVEFSDQGDIAYAKRFVGSGVNDLLVSRFDGSRSCVLDATASAALGSVHFSPEAGTVLWARASTTGFDAYHSRPSDCGTEALASDVNVLGWIGRGHAIFVDEVDAARSSGSLRFRKVGINGRVHPDPPTLIAENVDTYATWGPDLLLYTISAGTEQDGAYVRAFGR